MSQETGAESGRFPLLGLTRGPHKAPHTEGRGIHTGNTQTLSIRNSDRCRVHFRGLRVNPKQIGKHMPGSIPASYRFGGAGVKEGGGGGGGANRGEPAGNRVLCI